MEVKPIMDKHTNYNELDSKNVSDQTSSDNLSNDNIVHQQSTIQNEESQDNRLMAMLIYLLSLFTGIIGPLIIWLIKRKESRLVDVSGKTYLNYFISYTIYSTVGVICMFMIIPLMNISESLAIFSLILLLVVVFILLALLIMSFVCTIIACVKYMSGKTYTIPLTIPFIK